MSAGASPQTPLGELTALPETHSWFQGAASRKEGMEGTTRGRRKGGEKGEWEREGKGGVGE